MPFWKQNILRQLLRWQLRLPVLLHGLPRYLGILFVFLIAWQGAQLFWQIALFNNNPIDPILRVSKSNATQGEWGWLQQVQAPVTVVAPKKSYRFLSFEVTIVGLIYKESGNSVVIISSKLGVGMILAAKEKLGDTDIVLDAIYQDRVEFVEADKRFTVFLDVTESLFSDQQKPVAVPADDALADDAKSTKAKQGNNPFKAPVADVQEYKANDAARKLMQDVAKRPQDLLKYLNLLPVYEDKKMTGIKVTILGKRTVFESMGIFSGDLITHIDSKHVKDINPASLSRFMSAPEANLRISRRGNQYSVTVKR